MQYKFPTLIIDQWRNHIPICQEVVGTSPQIGLLALQSGSKWQQLTTDAGLI